MPEDPQKNPDFSPATPRAISRDGWTETHLTVAGLGETAKLEAAVARLPVGAKPVSAEVFGSADEIAAWEEALRSCGLSTPLTRVLSSARGQGGIQIAAATGRPAKDVAVGGRVVGFLVEGERAKHLFLGGIEPADLTASRKEQAEEVFSMLERGLAAAGMTFSDVARTWFYNDRILEWYAAFNSVRTACFMRHGITRMPASTGIGAPNPARVALVAKARAVQAIRPGAITIEPARSPLQCDAFKYGSAFSRAMMVRDGVSRSLYVSGTASIDPNGKSAHHGDPAAQIRLTMDVVEAIVAQAGMQMQDISRAIAYFRNLADVRLWEDYLARSGLLAMPFIALGCDVCRDDLLFEVEVDVCQAGG